MPAIEINLRNITMSRKQRPFSFNCNFLAKVNHVVNLTL